MTSPMIELPEHQYMPYNADGQGPADDNEAVGEKCWCPDGPGCEVFPGFTYKAEAERLRALAKTNFDLYAEAKGDLRTVTYECDILKVDLQAAEDAIEEAQRQIDIRERELIRLRRSHR
jgi:hypothetical protein